MNTVRDVVESFRGYLEDATGRPSEDFKYPARFLYYHLNSVKNNIMFKDLLIKKRNSFQENIISTIDCVELKRIDIVECPCAPASGSYWFKSINPLPKIIEGIPLSVKSVDTFSEFSYIRWFNMEHKVNSSEPADSLQNYYTFKNVDNKFHLYIYSTKDLDDLRAVTVAGIFQDSLDVRAFNSCGEIGRVICNPLDEPFILPEEIKSEVFQETFKMLNNLLSFNRGLSDKLNDSNVGTVQPV